MVASFRCLVVAHIPIYALRSELLVNFLASITRPRDTNIPLSSPVHDVSVLCNRDYRPSPWMKLTRKYSYLVCPDIHHKRNNTTLSPLCCKTTDNRAETFHESPWRVVIAAPRWLSPSRDLSALQQSHEHTRHSRVKPSIQTAHSLLHRPSEVLTDPTGSRDQDNTCYY